MVGSQFLDQLFDETALSVPYLKDVEEIDIWTPEHHHDESAVSSTFSTKSKGVGLDSG